MSFKQPPSGFDKRDIAAWISSYCEVLNTTYGLNSEELAIFNNNYENAYANTINQMTVVTDDINQRIEYTQRQLTNALQSTWEELNRYKYQGDSPILETAAIGINLGQLMALKRLLPITTSRKPVDKYTPTGITVESDAPKPPSRVDETSVLAWVKEIDKWVAKKRGTNPTISIYLNNLKPEIETRKKEAMIRMLWRPADLKEAYATKSEELRNEMQTQYKVLSSYPTGFNGGGIARILGTLKAYASLPTMPQKPVPPSRNSIEGVAAWLKAVARWAEDVKGTTISDRDGSLKWNTDADRVERTSSLWNSELLKGFEAGKIDIATLYSSRPSNRQDIIDSDYKEAAKHITDQYRIICPECVNIDAGSIGFHYGRIDALNKLGNSNTSGPSSLWDKITDQVSQVTGQILDVSGKGAREERRKEQVLSGTTITQGKIDSPADSGAAKEFGSPSEFVRTQIANGISRSDILLNAEQAISNERDLTTKSWLSEVMNLVRTKATVSSLQKSRSSDPTQEVRTKLYGPNGPVTATSDVANQYTEINTNTDTNMGFYLIGGGVAILVGIAAYYYANN